MNLPVILGSALIPTIIGFLWYNPKVFGNTWMQAAEMTEDKMKGGNMAVIFGVSIFLSILLAVQVFVLVVHQAPIESLFAHQTSDADQQFLRTFLETYGHLHLSFGHGVLHGLIAGFFFVVPVIVTNALFERKSFKYIAVNSGYWIVTVALMGGVICQWGYTAIR
jgi:hypothetical protein